MSWRVDNADARVWLPSLVGQVDPAHTVVITDPPWKGAAPSDGWDPIATWRDVAPLFAGLCYRLVVTVGCLTDIGWIASHVPSDLPFHRTLSLRYLAPWNVGPEVIDQDFALVWGDKSRGPGQRCFPGNCTGTVPQAVRRKPWHPCPRDRRHVGWLIRWYTKPKDLVIDPFMGSGTTGEQAVLAGRDFFGCDTEPAYVEGARREIAEAAAAGVQGDMMEAMQP